MLLIEQPIAQERPPSLWRNRDFLWVLFGQGISNLGDAVSATALPLLVLALTGSAAQMGLIAMLGALPNVFFGLPAGALADRWDRRRVMLLCDIGRALLTGVIPLAVLLGLPLLPVIYAVTLPLATLGVLFGAAYSACVPALVGRAQIGRASAAFEALESGSWVIGPAIAGLLAATVGAASALAIDALSFLASAAALGAVRRALQAEQPAAQLALLAAIGQGLQFVAKHATLRALLIYRALERVASAGFMLAVTYTLTIGQGRGAEQVGMILSLYAAGSLVGTLLGGRVSRGPVGRLLLGGVITTGLAAALFGASGALPLMALAASMYGLAEGLVLVLYLTIRGTHTPDQLMGRVIATFTTVVLGAGALGMPLAGASLDTLGGSPTLLVMGALIAAVGLGCLASRALAGAATSDE